MSMKPTKRCPLTWSTCRSKRFFLLAGKCATMTGIQSDVGHHVLQTVRLKSSKQDPESQRTPQSPQGTASTLDWMVLAARTSELHYRYEESHLVVKLQGHTLSQSKGRPPICHWIEIILPLLLTRPGDWTSRRLQQHYHAVVHNQIQMCDGMQFSICCQEVHEMCIFSSNRF